MPTGETMTINPPTKAKKAIETKAEQTKRKYVAGLERELHRAKAYGLTEDRIKEIEKELAKFKPKKAKDDK